MHRNATLLLSFALGAVFTLGVQTSTVVQRVFAQTPPPPCPKEPVLPEEIRKTFGGQVIVIGKSKPAVPDTLIRVSGENSGAIQQLDGVDCDGCTFRANLLTYAGGQFKCTNCSISSQNGVFLEGAASNTLHLLRLMGAIPGVPAPRVEPPNPNKPQVQTAALTTPVRMDWVSLAK